MSRIRRFFRDNELEAPNRGSWARRVATALEKTEGHGSWARRAIVDIDAENDLGPGSWTTRTNRAIEQELLSAGGGPPELVQVRTGSTSTTAFTDVQAGDLFVAGIAGREGSPSIAGFTALGQRTTFYASVYGSFRVADGSEGSFSVSSPPTSCSVAIVQLRNATLDGVATKFQVGGPSLGTSDFGDGAIYHPVFFYVRVYNDSRSRSEPGWQPPLIHLGVTSSGGAHSGTGQVFAWHLDGSSPGVSVGVGTLSYTLGAHASLARVNARAV